MIAKFFDALFKLGDSYRDDLENERDSKRIVYHMAKLEALRDVDEALQEAWDNGESMKTELFAVKPTKVEDIAILDIRGLRIFQDPADGHIFYELEKRHFDTEKEVIAWVIDEYNHKWIERRQSKPLSHFTNAGYKDITKMAKQIVWKQLKDGTYERKPLPEIREV